MQESIVDWKEAGRMLAEGFNFKEIAEHFGVSRQCIHFHYTRGNKSMTRNKHKIIYPAIHDWMKSNRENYYTIGRQLYPGVKVPGNTIRLILIGKTRNVPIDTIKKLSKITGMTFEEMFRTEDENDQ